MIIEIFFNLVKGLFNFLVGLLPTLNYMIIPEGLLEWLGDVIESTSYFLPISDFLLMFGIWFLITQFYIVWKTLQRVWDALPFT